MNHRLLCSLLLPLTVSILPLTSHAQEGMAETTVSSEPTTTSAPGSQGLNPRISLILQGGFADFESDEHAEIPGFLLGPETEFREEGFSLGETELSIEANIDDRYRGWATVAMEEHDGDTEVHIEEAYIQTLSMPFGFGLKFGRFLSDIGYMNRQHGHAWDFADPALPYRAMLAKHLGDDGLQLRWLAPTDLFIELGAEALRGRGFPGSEDDGVGTWTAFGRIGGDLSRSSSWRAGLSRLEAEPVDREVEEHHEPLHGFSGESHLNIVDFVYKWAPHGNPRERNFVFQFEYFDRDEAGVVTDLNTDDSSDYQGEQSGYYVQAVYQFMPRWRLGLRYDRLKADNHVDNPVADTLLEELAEDEGRPERSSVMIDYSRSEFSRLRLQFNEDDSRATGQGEQQIILQYIHSLGAHPAHQF